MTEPMQIDIDGGETPHRIVCRRKRRPPRLAAVQVGILGLAGRPGGVRAREAGGIVIGHRHPDDDEIADLRRDLDRKYRATDGSAACIRLMKRGLLVRTGRGRYQLTPGVPYVRLVSVEVEPHRCEGQTSLTDDGGTA